MPQYDILLSGESTSKIGTPIMLLRTSDSPKFYNNTRLRYI